MAPCVFERVHLAMQDGAAFLHAPIVTATEDAAVVHQDRADGDTAFAQTLLRFLDGGLKKDVVHVSTLPAAARHARSLPRSEGKTPRGAGSREPACPVRR